MDNAYQAVVQVTFVDTPVAYDWFTVTWLDKAGMLLSVVSEATITLHDMAGNTKLGETNLSSVTGLNGTFYLIQQVTLSRIPLHGALIATLRANIDGETRTWRQPVIRP